ncbi:MAG: UDP-N-acetylmuramoyl-tripeptide--D-alanyl-D-alanine ligase [Lewinella sp.]|nr:UDP-N-acetylmuramoyl-tripeptide--D-alanyl-D-alanine ligase [Lewinella sp.]
MSFTTTEELYTHFRQQGRVTTDSRRILPEDIFFALRGDRFDGHDYADQALADGAAYAVVDRKSAVQSDRYLLVPDVLEALQSLARHHRRQFALPVVAITGSNGKTTTKELMAAVLGGHYRLHFTQGNFNNHIGVPLTLLAMPGDTEIAVIEMGANHQGEIDALCRIAEPTHGLITNIGYAHLEGFGGLEGVKKGKSELYRYLAATKGVAFINEDEKYLGELAVMVGRKVYYHCSEHPDPDHVPMEIVCRGIHPHIQVAFLGEGARLYEAKSQLSGVHNLQNIKTAIAVGKYFKVPATVIVEAIEGYVPANNRSQWLERGGVRYFLDAYNANPSSMAASLDNFARQSHPHRAVILGDMLELGEESEAAHRRIAEQAVGLGFSKVILVGPHFRAAAESLGLPHYADVAALKAAWDREDHAGQTILLKGSRGMALEGLLAEG